MENTTLDRHRCLNPRCGRPFALVFRRSPADAPVWLALACPHCGTAHMMMVPTGGLHEPEGAYVLPLGTESVALSA